MTEKQIKRPGPESTLDMTRNQLVAEATDMLLAEGVEFGLAQLRLTDVIASVGVSRATAYRSLAHDDLVPQEVLHREVVSQVLNRATRATSHDDAAAAVAVAIEEHADNIASPLVADRMAALREIIRVGGAASYHHAATSKERAILTAAYGAIRSQGRPPSDWQRTELRNGEVEVTKLFVEMYTSLTDLLRLRLKEQYTMHQFSTAVASMLEGMAMRAQVNDHLEAIMLATGSDGELQEWTLFAIALEGLVHSFFEPAEAQENDTAQPTDED